MSKNLSALSFRKGVEKNVFERMVEAADIVDAMSSGGDVDGVIARVSGEVAKLTARFPVYAA